MRLSIPIGGALALVIDGRPAAGVERRPAGARPSYPSAQLAHGLKLTFHGEDLAEEGVGFAVPIVKRGPQTVFPGAVEVGWRRSGDLVEVEAAFTMNLVELLTGAAGDAPRPAALYAARDLLAALHRRAPLLRKPMTGASNLLRRALGWTTTFAAGPSHGTVLVRSTLVDGERTVAVAVDPSGLSPGVTELVVMNELGARRFAHYWDAAGLRLDGPRIGSWDAVDAQVAGFRDDDLGIGFSVANVAGARLHRGRELVGERLSWAGFGYSLAPPAGLRYTIEISGPTPHESRRP
jgi:hypothetical protein